VKQHDFQLYLLSRMRASARVDDALRALGATRGDLSLSALSAQRMGFEEPGHSTDLYRAVLGEPHTVEPAHDIAADSPFVGSRILRFSLSSWSDFDFSVREHPSNYAWGVGFERAHAAVIPTLQSVVDLAPWGFVEAEVTARLGEPTRTDAWSDWEDLCYSSLDAAGVMRRYLLQFDFNLLQNISVLDEVRLD
jgi:hypothetical protein